MIQKEYGFCLVQMSLILTSFSWTYAFLQVPTGWLAERIGRRRALYWANLLWSLLSAATPLGFNLPTFVAIRAALGVGQPADWPALLPGRFWVRRSGGRPRVMAPDETTITSVPRATVGWIAGGLAPLGTFIVDAGAAMAL